MELTHSSDENFIPPQYVVHSFYFSVNEHDNDSQLEVRRHGKCFYITMAAENFTDAPPIKQQYLSYLAAERSGMTDDGSMAEDYHEEDLYAWALEPCLPLFESLAPAPPTPNLKTTLHDFLHPEVFYISLRAVDGEVTPVQSDGRGAGMLPLGLELEDSVFSPAWPSLPSTAIELCIPNPEDEIISASGAPNKVLATLDGKREICFVKMYQHGDNERALRELATYRRITESDLDPDVRICRLRGVIKDKDEEDRNLLIGLLLTYIDCDFVTLSCAGADTLPSSTTKQRWVNQVTDTLTQLHNAGIVWGDAKTDNVLIDKKNHDAWIIDFGGGYTRGFVEREKAGTREGDLQGLEKIVEYVLREREE